MCGIIGYVGCEPQSNQVLLDGLKALEYRGYDSAGMAIVVNRDVRVIKTRGKVANLEKKIEDLHLPSSVLGIAHTRWATHGIPNQSNAHPHQHGMVTLVHNGIIENYGELKELLTKQGYVFESETDTEIAAAYLDYVYKKSFDKKQALQEANKAFRGSFAFGIIFADEQDTLYAMRRNSPLIVAVGEHERYIASDVPAILKYTKDYILLDQDEIAVLKKDEVKIYTLDLVERDYEVKTATMDASAIAKDGYEHFMLKEIHEEPRVVKDTMHAYVQDDIEQLVASLPDLRKYQQIHIVSCGSAMYAGMIAKSLIEQAARIRVDVEIASEYRYKHPIYDVPTLVLIVSQSGETADSLAALLLAKSQGVDTMAIVNVIGSSIAREAKYVAYTHAGVEIAVATTKAYCTQVALLSLMALNLAYVHGHVDKKQANAIIQEVQQLPEMLEHMIEDVQYVQAAKIISRHNNVFFLGRGLDYALCMEASLKLKEISYIHSEAYAAGELKHGTISLIEKGTPVIAICTEESLYEKTISNIKEVKARGANVILVVREDFNVGDDYYDYKISVPKVNRLIQGIVSVVPLQLLSYQVANLRGCEIDQPRNLAKSVTVE